MKCDKLLINSLMFGGFNFIVVESIWVTKTHNNYRYVILALSYLDTMINGQKVVTENDDDKAIEILCDLVRYAANGMLKDINIDRFMLSTFQCFVENKKEIKLDLYMLLMTNKRIRDTIMYQMVKHESEVRKFERLKETDSTNLFRPELFRIFTKAKSLILKVSTGRDYYPFSWLALLRMIKMSNLEKVVIKVNLFLRAKYKCWMQEIWRKSDQEFKEAYNAENYSISMQIVSTSKFSERVEFMIEKQNM